MSDVLGQDRVTVWFQPDGRNTPFKVLGIGANAASMTGKTIPGPGRTPLYGRDRYGRPVVIKMTREAPGDLPGATLQIYDKGQVDFLLDALNRGCPINVQTRITSCGNLSNPNNWDAIDHWGGGEISQYTPGDGPGLEYSGEALTAEAQISFTHHVRIVRTELSALGTPTADDIVYAITGVTDAGCDDCIAGYPGADKYLFIGVSDGAAVPVLNVSRNGGTSWAALTASGAGAAAAIVGLAVNLLGRNTVRLVLATGTEIRYTDVTMGDEAATLTWNVGAFLDEVGGAVTPTAVQAMGWLYYDGLYVAADGDIYRSVNQGEILERVYSGAVVINTFAVSYDEATVFAAGATGLLLREADGNGEFVARVAPDTALAVTALAVAGDGLLYMGYGTGIYVSKDEGYAAGNWTLLKNFGAGASVVKIQCVGGDRAMGGDSQLLRAIVNSSTAGQVWESVDGGANWVQVTALAAAEYHDAYFSQVSDNKAVVVGEGSADAAIHSLAAVN